MHSQSLRGRIKTNARRAVTQNYVRSLCVVLILASVLMLLYILSVVANLLMEFFGPQLRYFIPILSGWNYVFSPIVVSVSLLMEWVLFSALILGVARWFYRLCGGEPCDVIDVFDCFAGGKRYFGALWLELNLFVRRLFWSLIFLCVPVAICLCGAAVLSGRGITLFGMTILGGRESMNVLMPQAASSVIGTMLLIAGSVLTAAAAIFLWVFLKRYFLARYLYAGNEGYSVRRAVKQSVYFMKGRKSDLFVFDLSFLGWLIACLALIPAFYAVPYYLCSRALYARVLIELHERRTDAPAEPTREFGGEESDGEEQEYPPQPEF